MVTKQVAVVGGGLAGAMCADTLASKGIQVCVMDMGRRATGGRASVRYTQEVRPDPFPTGVQGIACTWSVSE